MPRLLRFVLSYVLVGIAVAVAVVKFAPDLLRPEPQRAIVELRRAPQQPATALGEGVVSYAAAVERAAPAVVNVFTSKRVAGRSSPLLNDPFFRHFFGDALPGTGRERIETSLGSGVIVSPQGYVLTNNHVIDGADQIHVALADGRFADATLVGADPDTDLAVLRIALQDLPVVNVGRSDTAKVGDVVLAIGNPFGVGQTVTQGIISATGRTQLGLSTFEDFIQTDAAINPGNSGGALITAHGDLIGINTAIFSRSGGSMGIGFAIPVQLAEQVLSNIIEHGRVIRGWLGIEAQMITPQLAESFGLTNTDGVIIAGVLRNGPADRAGLQPADIVLRLNDQAVHDSQSLLRLITQRKPGDTLKIIGLRNGQEFQAEATVAERPAARR
ncbi:MAG TPA: trypsin-like peptidase domain-containing protein [Gammaproteobacteria bacterium]|nr:trypsin-like peptidase domain-containing protein [Gammaproteobacteria bacterium]